MSTRRILESRDDRRPISAALARALDLAEARAHARSSGNGTVWYMVRTSERVLVTNAAAGEIEGCS